MCCEKTFASSGAARLVDHLLSCSMCPKAVRTAFQNIRAKTTEKRVAKRDTTALAEEEQLLALHEQAVEQNKLKQQSIRAGFKTVEAVAADQAIAQFFYANAIPFSAASEEEGSLFRKMVAAIQKAPAAYVAPSPKKIAGELLDKSYADMWQQLKLRDPTGKLRDKFGSCYVSDGWDSCDSLPLINSAFITANDGGMYWRSVDTSGKTKSAEYCAMLMVQDIYAYGPTHVVLVITDTCNTMAKACGG